MPLSRLLTHLSRIAFSEFGPTFSISISISPSASASPSTSFFLLPFEEILWIFLSIQKARNDRNLRAQSGKLSQRQANLYMYVCVSQLFGSFRPHCSTTTSHIHIAVSICHWSCRCAADKKVFTWYKQMRLLMLNVGSYSSPLTLCTVFKIRIEFQRIFFKVFLTHIFSTRRKHKWFALEKWKCFVTIYPKHFAN